MATHASKEAEIAPKSAGVVDTEEVRLSHDIEGPTTANPIKHIRGAYMSIFLAAAAPCVVVFIVSGVLIAMTLGTNIGPNTGLPALDLPSASSASGSLLTKLRSFTKTGGTDAYYIDFNPSSLTTIASWTGKLIPYLSSAMMGLAGFFVANHIRQASRAGQTDKLLTPEQMALVLGLLSGGLQQLWEVMRYRSRRGSKLQEPIPIATVALVFTTALGQVLLKHPLTRNCGGIQRLHRHDLKMLRAQAFSAGYFIEVN
jgi:hypothetical protein